MKNIGFILLIFFFISSSQAQTGLEIMKKMVETNAGIKTLKFDFLQKERVKGKMNTQISSFKVNVSPKKVYMKQATPRMGMELLYVSGSNNNDVLVHPNAFPWTNLNLGLNNEHMRVDQHHSIDESGFGYVVEIIDHLLNKYKNTVGSLIKLDGVVKMQGVDCYKITLLNPYFKYSNYTLKAGETAYSLADKIKINDYMIIDKNPSITKLEDCKAGVTINIPNDYAQKMEIWIDKSRMIPLVMKIYDDKGLYEEYDFTNVVINPTFATDEFTKTFAGYKF